MPSNMNRQSRPTSHSVFSLLTSHFSLPTLRAGQRLRGCAAVALASALLGLGSGCTGVNWEHDQEAGLRKAAKNRQRAVIEFVSGFDEATSKMDKEVFADPDVVRLMQRFVPIRLDVGMDPKLAEQFGVKQTPWFVVVRPDMTVSGTSQAIMKPDQFRLFLIRNSLN